MLSIGILSLESLEYYLDLAAEDYFFKGGEPPGKWLGGGAQILGLTGIVNKDDFRKVFVGLHPRSGEPLVQNAAKTKGYGKRRPGWDFTFSIPKDASCLVTTKIWEAIRSIHAGAVQDAMELLEATRTVVRVGSVSQGSWRFERASIVAALFEHLVSRELDPQLHTHALLGNLGIAADGKFRALHSPPFFGKHQRHFVGAYYRAVVAHRLWKELQLETYRKGTSFGIRGVPKSLIGKRSKRRKQILAHLRKKGQSGGAAAARAALETRRTKTDIPPREELHKRWRRENEAHGLTPRAVRRIQRAKSRDHQKDLPKALAKSLKNMSRGGASHFTEIRLQIEALQEAPNWGLPPKMVLDALAEYIKAGEKVVSLGIHNGEKRYTTPEILQRERRMLSHVDALRSATGSVADLGLVKRIVGQFPNMKDEQRQAVEHLTRAPGCIRLMDGRAGTGKTSMVLKACKEIWEKQGYRVIGAAPTGKAAIELEEATGIPTDTIHWRLADFNRSFGFKCRHHLKQLARAFRGKRTYRLKHLKPVRIDRNTILVVDEVGMVDTRHWENLTELVNRNGGTVVAVGDGRQLPPVDGGAPFQSLCNRIGCAKLREIVRQKEEWAQEATKLVSQGKAGQALAMYAERGLVTVGEDMDEALEILVRDWSVRGIQRPERAPILVSTNEEAETVNDLCQQARLKAGVLSSRKSTEIVDEDESRDITYRCRVYQGDRVVLTRNDRRLDVRNGFTGTVIGISPFGRSISVRLDDGRCVIIPVKEYKHIRRGYGLTVHKAQGATYVEDYVLAGLGQALPAAYVELSRAVLATNIYTSKALLDERLKEVEDSPLAKQMSKMPDLSLASDLLQGVQLEGVQLDEPTDQTAKQEQLPTLSKERKPWWDTEPNNSESVQPTPWWEKDSQTASMQPARQPAIPPERERMRQDHAARRMALEKAKRERARREQEERRRYAMAQREADRRRKALLAQVLLASSSVPEHTPMRRGNAGLLTSSLAAMFNFNQTKNVREERPVNPISESSWTELFAPPVKEVPAVAEAEFLTPKELDLTDLAGVADTVSVEVDYEEYPRYQAPEPVPQATEPTETYYHAPPRYDHYDSSSSSSLQPASTSCLVSTQATSTHQDTQAANTAMASSQFAGAAQTAATQAASQATTSVIVTQTNGWGG